MKTSLKDWPKVYQKLKGMRGMSKEEKVQFARCQAATPEERLQMNDNCIKSVGLWGGIRSLKDLERRKAKLRGMKESYLRKFRLSDEELASGRMLGIAKPNKGTR